MTYKLVCVSLILFTIFLGFIIYEIFLQDKIKKNTKNKFIKCILSSSEGCNALLTNIFWITTHFILYFILGLIIPNQWAFIIISIILWELYEKSRSITNEWFNEGYKTIFDILADILGYSLDAFIITKIAIK